MRELLPTLLDEFQQQLITINQEAVPRTYKLPEARKFIKVAIGMRRTGKSYFLYQQVQKLLTTGVDITQILFINFEDDRLLPLETKALGNIIDEFYTLHPNNHDKICYFFLDEIQNVEGWPVVVRRILDSKSCQIFLTGSSAKLLSKEIATSLRGRTLAIEIWPFSLQEYVVARNITLPTFPLSKRQSDKFAVTLQQYIRTGGFPAILELNQLDARNVLQNYVDTVILRDIIERYKVKNIELFKCLTKTLLKNIACPFAVNKFFNNIKSQGYKVGKDTLYTYLQYLEDAYLIFTIPIFQGSMRKERARPKKVYAIDSGLVIANTFNIDKNLGALFENLVYLDLRRAGNKIFYYNTAQGFEVDFLVEKQDGTRKLLQVTWQQDDSATFAREQRALNQAMLETGLDGEVIDAMNYLKFLDSININYCK